MSSFKDIINLAVWYNCATQTLDPNDSGWSLVKGWFDDDDDDDKEDTLEMPLPEDFCKKCRVKMKELNTGLRKRIYACPNCDK